MIRGSPIVRRLRPGLAVLLLNLVFTIVGLALVAGIGEAYWRLTVPFIDTAWPSHFDPAVGFLLEPNAQVRLTNNLDFWNESRSNELGFLDRPSPSPQQDAAGCHIAVIGDSFVEAAQVPIADKFHVQLEKMASKQMPEWQISTSAYGYSGTGQLNQLPFYDLYARKLHPKLVVLVFAYNDFANNSSALEAIRNGWDPDHPPRVFAFNADDGSTQIQPIDPEWQQHLLPVGETTEQTRWARLLHHSYFGTWIQAKVALLLSPRKQDTKLQKWAELLSQRPRYRNILEGWQPKTIDDLDFAFRQKELPPVFEQALQFTGFALDEFKRRADNGHASLLILSSYLMHAGGDGAYLHLKQLAEARGIPLVDQWDYVEKVGGDLQKVTFPHYGHWSLTGHRWAAEALLAWLKDHPSVCVAHASWGPARD